MKHYFHITFMLLLIATSIFAKTATPPRIAPELHKDSTSTNPLPKAKQSQTSISKKSSFGQSTKISSSILHDKRSLNNTLKSIQTFRNQEETECTQQNLDLIAKLSEMLESFPSLLHWRNEKGQTLLAIAVACNKSHLLPTLIRAGSDINAQDIDGNTPLLVAIENGDSASVIVLLAFGADPMIQNNRKYDAYSLACMLNRTTILSVLNFYKNKEKGHSLTNLHNSK